MFSFYLQEMQLRLYFERHFSLLVNLGPAGKENPMEPSLLVLKLFLDELGIALDVNTLADRKRIQKAVYLGQRGGVDLGYRFGWYLMGPYCPALAQTYYQFSPDQVASDDSLELAGELKDRLAAIRPLMSPPKNLSLAAEDWLELVASVDFLRTVSKLDMSAIRERLQEEKPALVNYVDTANEALLSMKLLQT